MLRTGAGLGGCGLTGGGTSIDGVTCATCAGGRSGTVVAVEAPLEGRSLSMPRIGAGLGGCGLTGGGMSIDGVTRGACAGGRSGTVVAVEPLPEGRSLSMLRTGAELRGSGLMTGDGVTSIDGAGTDGALGAGTGYTRGIPSEGGWLSEVPEDTIGRTGTGVGGKGTLRTAGRACTGAVSGKTNSLAGSDACDSTTGRGTLS